MTILTQELVRTAPRAALPVAWPTAEMLALPEKVLQFGTGVLLRGLPDFMIDEANRQGVFNGRIVVVKSTDGGDATAFDRQNGLYTVCVRGVDDGKPVEENVVCASISRVLSAKSQWADVLEFATSSDLQVVISNTTEVGIQLVNEDIHLTPPQSFPGKLLAVLYARFQAFKGDASRGLVVVPTELITDNGRKLEAIVLELAHRNDLGSEFIDWLESANNFCNTLVDRIVPGRPDPATYEQLQTDLGYQDELLTVAEAYSLWAIEGGEEVREILSFHSTAQGVVIRPDITLFRELKLRLLNGTHTLSYGLAHLVGCTTVREALDNECLARFIHNLMLADLLPGIPYAVDEKVGQRFGMQVLDRFRNPYLEHRWMSIAMQGTTKMQMRNVPTLLHYYQQHQAVPHYMALGFAAYLLFMRNTTSAPGVGHGESNGEPYTIIDDRAGYFADLWARVSPPELTTTVLGNTALWGHDLTRLPGFADCVSQYLTQLMEEGAAATLVAFFTKKSAAVNS
ncbi:altronate oxidoreductase [Hymenobacter sedentarius]|uniref:Altronate oxidoreductase n=1 Tax=Hymenobacter sedentarius TaxID=1411621 RepID=A0A0U4CL50_9BACT|nr:tagaturonate reductase [Hymenobacter sedentarius]ALW83966.1 altronate oxidoreductase [Hymenobacter sedentarius]